MTVAFDIDGTLSRDTKQLTKLMKVLKDSGNTVVVLTGSGNGLPSREDRLKQLEALNITPDLYNELVIAEGKDLEKVGRGKGKFCRERKVDILFEDDDFYISLVNMEAPDTSTWLIRRW